MQVKLSDLLAAAKAADADQAAKGQALSTATSNKAHADTTVAETHSKFAGVVRSRGNIFIDTSVSPLVQYTVTETGDDYTTKTVAGPDDTVDVPDEPAPPVVPVAVSAP